MTTTLKELENRFEDHVNDMHWDVNEELKALRKEITALTQIKLRYEDMTENYSRLLDRVEVLEKTCGVRD